MYICKGSEMSYFNPKKQKRKTEKVVSSSELERNGAQFCTRQTGQVVLKIMYYYLCIFITVGTF